MSTLGNEYKNSMKKDIITKGESMPGADIYVDGNRIGEIGNAVMRERKIMSNDLVRASRAGDEFHYRWTARRFICCTSRIVWIP